MIAVLKNGVTKAQRDNLVKWLEAQNVRVHVSEGEMQTVLGLIGEPSFSLALYKAKNSISASFSKS